MNQALMSAADAKTPGLLLMCRLMKGNRQTGRSRVSNGIQTPWGQPEPATRDLHSKAGSPRQQAQPVCSQDGPAAADRYVSSKDVLNRVCMMGLPVCWCLACKDLHLLQLGPETVALIRDSEHLRKLLVHRTARACPVFRTAVWAYWT